MTQDNTQVAEALTSAGLHHQLQVATIILPYQRGDRLPDCQTTDTRLPDRDIIAESGRERREDQTVHGFIASDLVRGVQTKSLG